MSDKVEVVVQDELKDGKMKAVMVNGDEILLAKVEGKYYAVSNICPHMKGRLSEGILDGFTVTCPRHGSRFDIRDGGNLRWLKGSGIISNIAKAVKPPRAVKSYPVQFEDGKVTIHVR